MIPAANCGFLLGSQLVPFIPKQEVIGKKTQVFESFRPTYPTSLTKDFLPSVQRHLALGRKLENPLEPLTYFSSKQHNAPQKETKKSPWTSLNNKVHVIIFYNLFQSEFSIKTHLLTPFFPIQLKVICDQKDLKVCIDTSQRLHLEANPKLLRPWQQQTGDGLRYRTSFDLAGFHPVVSTKVATQYQQKKWYCWLLMLQKSG